MLLYGKEKNLAKRVSALRKCAKSVVRAEGMSAEIAKRKLSRRCGFITLLS
jgi:hypothetical protein